MTIYEDTNSKPLLDLLDRIHSGDMVLPDFQRDFVWEPSATQALIVSIANNYPAESILRMHDRFAWSALFKNVTGWRMQGAPTNGNLLCKSLCSVNNQIDTRDSLNKPYRYTLPRAPSLG